MKPPFIYIGLSESVYSPFKNDYTKKVVMKARRLLVESDLYVFRFRFEVGLPFLDKEI